MTKMNSLGKQLLVELYDCDPVVLNDISKVELALLRAVEISGATIIKPFFHTFSPHGVSGVVVIAESHFAVHTWPEYGYCAVDIFTCGDKINGDVSVKYLKTAFKAKRCSVTHLDRGTLELPVQKLKHKPDA